VLKRSYGRLVEVKMRVRINHINKLDFLEAYPLARRVGVRRRISNFEITLSGAKGTKPAAPKLFLIVSDLNDWDPKTPSNYVQL
jgi:hypothetical protein